MLTALPGIGPKTARRIIVELKDKFVKLAEDELPVEDEGVSGAMKEAIDALVTLGFKQHDVTVILQKISAGKDAMTSEELIKAALAGLN